MYQVQVTKLFTTREPETKVLMRYHTTEEEALAYAERLRRGYNHIGLDAKFSVIEATLSHAGGGEQND